MSTPVQSQATNTIGAGVGSQFFEIVSEIKVLVKTRRQKKRPSTAGREMSNGR